MPRRLKPSLAGDPKSKVIPCFAWYGIHCLFKPVPWVFPERSAAHKWSAVRRFMTHWVSLNVPCVPKPDRLERVQPGQPDLSPHSVASLLGQPTSQCGQALPARLGTSQRSHVVSRRGHHEERFPRAVPCQSISYIFCFKIFLEKCLVTYFYNVVN